MSIRGSDSQTIETIAVIGAGTMGHGIAQVAGASGFRVTLSDVDPGVTDARHSLDREESCQGHSTR
jgi:3-hydroxyacyl-CoA dehydrogenase